MFSLCLFFFQPIFGPRSFLEHKPHSHFSPQSMTSVKKGKRPSTVLLPLSLNGLTDKAPPNNPSNSQAATAQLPPMNWATKPEPEDNSCDSRHSETAGHQLVPFCIDPDHLVQVEDTLLSRCLTESSSLASPHVDEQPDNFVFQQSEPEYLGDGYYHQSTEIQDLTASFLHLSVLENLTPSELFLAQSVPLFGPAPLGSPTKKKYYVVTVGRCTGVFWDTWCTYISFIFVQLV
jgi:hypothetical protein